MLKGQMIKRLKEIGIRTNKDFVKLEKLKTYEISKLYDTHFPSDIDGKELAKSFMN